MAKSRVMKEIPTNQKVTRAQCEAIPQPKDLWKNLVNSVNSGEGLKFTCSSRTEAEETFSAYVEALAPIPDNIDVRRAEEWLENGGIELYIWTVEV